MCVCVWLQHPSSQGPPMVWVTNCKLRAERAEANIGLCAAPPVPLWGHRGALIPGIAPCSPSGVQLWAVGGRGSPDPPSPSPGLRVGPPCPTAGVRSTRATPPPLPLPHAEGLPPVGEEEQRCATVPYPCALHPPPPTGTAVSSTHERLRRVQESSAVWAAVRPDNRRLGFPSRPFSPVCRSPGLSACP